MTKTYREETFDAATRHDETCPFCSKGIEQCDGGKALWERYDHAVNAERNKVV